MAGRAQLGGLGGPVSLSLPLDCGSQAFLGSRSDARGRLPEGAGIGAPPTRGSIDRESAIRPRLAIGVTSRLHRNR